MLGRQQQDQCFGSYAPFHSLLELVLKCDVALSQSLWLVCLVLLLEDKTTQQQRQRFDSYHHVSILKVT